MWGWGAIFEPKTLYLKKITKKVKKNMTEPELEL